MTNNTTRASELFRTPNVASLLGLRGIEESEVAGRHREPSSNLVAERRITLGTCASPRCFSFVLYLFYSRHPPQEICPPSSQLGLM